MGGWRRASRQTWERFCRKRQVLLKRKEKPLLEKIVQVLRPLYRTFIELKGKLDRL